MKYSNQMEKRKINRRTSRGFSVIEVMVAVVILGFGLLGVAKLHTTMMANSVDNKSRSEALTIARSRLEEMRNYSETVASRDEFDQAYSVTAGYVNDTQVPGNIADYARTEKISLSGTNRALIVQVGWTDESGSQQLVELESELAWQNPRSAADVLTALNKPLVDSATGRAHLGDGVLGDGDSTSDNDDGTKIFNLDNGDLGLVSGDQIVLTLEDACVADTCIDFVTVNGRVYIDRATQRNLIPGDIFVQASDAAFCQRYYYDAQGAVVVVDNDTTTVLSTANGDYDYFEYRCYVGGGWHGNIGLLLAGGIAQTDKVCMGDPVSLNKWEEPEMSIRRSYRGMLYKIVNGAKETFVDSEGVTRIRYYSQGVADASAIPAAEESTHDFIIASLSASLTTGENCVTQSVMLRTDSNVLGAPGSMFAGMPNDFICFNSEDILDEFDDAKFGAFDYCPYDPTDPPVTAHNISGTIAVVSASTDYLDTITVNTSDGEGNCRLGLFAQVSTIYTANYVCTIFDWGTGWEGYIETRGQIDKVACNPSRNTYTGVSSSIANEPFNCVIGNIVVVQGTITGPTTVALTSATISDGGICEIAGDGASYTCQSDAFFTSTWSGSVTFTNTGMLCPATGLDAETETATYTNILPGFYDLNLTIAENASQC